MLLLFRKSYEDDSFELLPIVISASRQKIDDYLTNLLKDSIDYDNKFQEHADKCKSIIREYLLGNYDAITGWRDVRAHIRTSFPIENKEKDRVIDFLCNNYSYSYGDNIIETANDNGFIRRYCDSSRLSNPYPKLPSPPKYPTPYYKREGFFIEEVKCLE